MRLLVELVPVGHLLGAVASEQVDDFVAEIVHRPDGRTNTKHTQQPKHTVEVAEQQCGRSDDCGQHGVGPDGHPSLLVRRSVDDDCQDGSHHGGDSQPRGRTVHLGILLAVTDSPDHVENGDHERGRAEVVVLEHDILFQGWFDLTGKKSPAI